MASRVPYPWCGQTGDRFEPNRGRKMLATTAVTQHEDEETSEAKLWRAVIVSTVWEWAHGPLRRRREAEEFLFRDKDDFKLVCLSAGIDPLNLRERLEKYIGSRASGNRKPPAVINGPSPALESEQNAGFVASEAQAPVSEDSVLLRCAV